MKKEYQMKKSYIIGILLVILLGAISFLATYNYSKNELLTDKLYEEQTKEQLVTVNNAPVDVITNKTKLIIEKYNKENNTLEEEYSLHHLQHHTIKRCNLHFFP